jgi:hypothetical protein
MAYRLMRTEDKNGGIELVHYESTSSGFVFIEDLGQRTAPATHLGPGPSFGEDMAASSLGDGISYNENGVRYRYTGTNALDPAEVTALVAVCLSHDPTDPRPQNPEEVAAENANLFMNTYTKAQLNAQRADTLYDIMAALGYGDAN